MKKDHKVTGSNVNTKSTITKKATLASGHKTGESKTGAKEHIKPRQTREFKLNDSSKKDLNSSKLESKHTKNLDSSISQSNTESVKQVKNTPAPSSNSAASAAEVKKLENEKKDLLRQLAE